MWLGAIGQKGWVAVSHDRHIRYKRNERDAVIRHNVALLVVVGDAPLPELARSFIATLPRITRFLKKNRPPFIAKVYRASPAELAQNSAAAGRIERWYPPA